MTGQAPPMKPAGRGAGINPAGRFEPLVRLPDADPPGPEDDGADAGPRTQFFRDRSRTVLNAIDSPDLGIERSLNPYRGCEHGCAYCYARPTHEYLGFSAGLDFETKIMVKEDAPALLAAELGKRGYVPRPVALSGVTDPYQPVERRLRLTRRLLELLAACRHPVGIVTKNHLVTRDADLLAELAGHGAAAVYLSITTLDRDLQRELEPRTSTPERRLDAIRTLAAAGVPVGVLVAPVIPALTDHELPAILTAAAAAGATFAGRVVLRLPHGVKEIFTDWLDRHRPLRKEKILNRIRDLRGGKLNDPRFGTRMRGEGAFADEIEALFTIGRKRSGLTAGGPALSTAAFRRPPPATGQLDLL